MRTRPGIELVLAQLSAIDAWNAANAASLRPQEGVSTSREVRLDHGRRMDVIREQHRAIVERADAHLRAAASLSVQPAIRAVVVHRSDWFRDKVCLGLEGHGIEVVARLSNGAQAIGCAVVEQPDLLLVEDLLPMVPGNEVVRQVRACSPGTRIGAQVEHDGRVSEFLGAGAHAAWTRRVPPGDIAHGLVALCGAPPQGTGMPGEQLLLDGARSGGRGAAAGR